MEKLCPKCNTYKGLEEFSKKTADKRQSYCKLCFNKYCAERWKNRKIEAILYKGGQCLDCGIALNDSNYVIYDFHHRNPKLKEFQWNKLRLRSIDSIKNELDKCDCVCSNCHRMRHQNP